MRFLLGVLIGYRMRGKRNSLIRVLTAVGFVVYILLPTTALLTLSLDVLHERQSRPAQTRVPALKGLSYESAERKLHASNLNIRLLATRYDLPHEPGLIIDQTPQLERKLFTVTLSALPLPKWIPMAMVGKNRALCIRAVRSYLLVKNGLDQIPDILSS
jgi:hypothetical protein